MNQKDLEEYIEKRQSELAEQKDMQEIGLKGKLSHAILCNNGYCSLFYKFRKTEREVRKLIY
jgi:hypothetical protein